LNFKFKSTKAILQNTDERKNIVKGEILRTRGKLYLKTKEEKLQAKGKLKRNWSDAKGILKRKLAADKRNTKEKQADYQWNTKKEQAGD
jgi:hypothetical protein